MEKTKTKLIIFGVLTLVLAGFTPIAARAASLYFSPSSGSYSVGGTLTTSVYVSSPDKAINAISGAVSFPSDKLELLSISKNGSIITLWVQEPSFSNDTGAVNFEGVILNPGFAGTSGKTIILKFKVKEAGNAIINFSSGSVLANDGLGTNILTNLGGAKFSLNAAEHSAPKAAAPSKTAGVPAAPQIFSSTHPNQNKWYRASDAKFTWPIPPEITADRLLVGRIPLAIPTVSYSPAIASKNLSNLADGIWYFHVRLKNNAGWSGTSNFRFQIDTKKPSYFDIQEIARKDLTDPKIKFTFDAQDKTSGIGHYTIQIDESSPRIWQNDKNGIYETPALPPGKHILIAKAVDKAGNSLVNSAEFTVKALKSPTITDYPKELTSGEILIIRGATYPGAQAVIWLQREKGDAENQIVKSDKAGNFTFIADKKLKDGIYKLWTEVIDKRGARSEPTEKIIIAVKQPEILKIGIRAINILTVVIPLIALILLLLIIIWYGWHKLSSFRRKIHKETKEAEQALSETIKLLKKRTKKYIKLLEKAQSKRQLTGEEDKIIKQLKKDLDAAEKFVGEKINDIENGIN